MVLGVIENQLQDLFQGIISITGILGLQGWLIVLTLVITGMSYRSQKRAGVREAIEQLKPRYTYYKVFYSNNGRTSGREVQINPGLHTFSLMRGRSKISFISNQINSRSDRTVGHSVPPYYLTLPEQQTERIITLEDRVLKNELIKDIERNDTEIIVTASTINPVKCRQVANYVLNEIDHTVRNQIHRSNFRPWPDS